jgi:hypothetical protein
VIDKSEEKLDPAVVLPTVNVIAPSNGFVRSTLESDKDVELDKLVELKLSPNNRKRVWFVVRLPVVTGLKVNVSDDVTSDRFTQVTAS